MKTINGMEIKRGDVKAFRELLNRSCAGLKNHKHGAFHQEKRAYGDYLYAQDREKFFADMFEWKSGRMVLVP